MKKKPSHKLPTAKEYGQMFTAETMAKLNHIINDINMGGGAVNFDYLNVFASTCDDNFIRQGHITELTTSSGRKNVKLTAELIDQMYSETIADREARAQLKANKHKIGAAMQYPNSNTIIVKKNADK